MHSVRFSELATSPSQAGLGCWLCLSLLGLFFRLLLGLLAAWATGCGTCVAGLSILSGHPPFLHFGIPEWTSMLDSALAWGAMVLCWGIAAMIPAILVLLILDQSSERFQKAPLRPLYAGGVGILVFWGWCMLLRGRLWPQIDATSIILCVACFLSGVTFAAIVTFPRMSRLWTLP
jgi:hypothetical protein